MKSNGDCEKFELSIHSFQKLFEGFAHYFSYPLELLQEARESQQKVVVYSQYFSMLDIIEHYLREEGIGFASLLCELSSH
jgi:SNF2 family DNA or RNA helicase